MLAKLFQRRHEELLYQASTKREMKKNCSGRPSLKQKRRRIGLLKRPLVAQGHKNEIPHDNRALWETFFQAWIWTNNVKELVYSLSKPKMKKDWSTKPPLEGKWRRIALPGSHQRENEEDLPSQASLEKKCSTKGKMKNCSTILPLKGKEELP